MKRFVMAALLAGAAIAHAQTGRAAPASSSASAPAPSSPAKKELVARILVLQQPSIEGLAREVALRPARQLGQEAAMALQTLPPEKRESAARSIDADIRRFIDEATPLLRERAIKAAPSTVGALLEEKMSEDELRQLAAWLDSPAARKYQQLAEPMQEALGQKLLAEADPLLTPKLQTLTQKLRTTLGVPPPAGAASGASAGKPARPASK